jgi:hypothetical protein
MCSAGLTRYFSNPFLTLKISSYTPPPSPYLGPRRSNAFEYCDELPGAILSAAHHRLSTPSAATTLLQLSAPVSPAMRRKKKRTGSVVIILPLVSLHTYASSVSVLASRWKKWLPFYQMRQSHIWSRSYKSPSSSSSSSSSSFDRFRIFRLC